MFDLASVMAPADLSFATTVASYGDTKLSACASRTCVSTPSVQKRSLCNDGQSRQRTSTPCSQVSVRGLRSRRVPTHAEW